MTLVAFISDIHANYASLMATLQKLEKLQVDAIYHVGDLVGYYTQPDEVLTALRERKINGILGNHDYLVIGGIMTDHLSSEAKDEIQSAFSSVTSAAKEVLDWTIKNVSRSSLGYLLSLFEQLTFEIDGVKFHIVHGCPDWFGSPLTTYMPQQFADKVPFKDEMERNGINVVVFGHTHVPYVLELEKGIRYVVNDGSVGQPRDGLPFATCALIEVNSGRVVSVDIIRIRYDLVETQMLAWQKFLPSEVAKRLSFGL